MVFSLASAEISRFQPQGAVYMAAWTLVLGPSSQLSGIGQVSLPARASVSSSIKRVPRPLSYLPHGVV